MVAVRQPSETRRDKMVVFVKILSANMGDGWADEREAANGYAKWLENQGIKAEVEYASGVGGVAFDEDGEETDIGHLWERWCASEEAKAYL
jgi:hypothetical protein